MENVEIRSLISFMSAPRASNTEISVPRVLKRKGR
jgi:hypothetical protein